MRVRCSARGAEHFIRRVQLRMAMVYCASQVVDSEDDLDSTEAV